MIGTDLYTPTKLTINKYVQFSIYHGIRFLLPNKQKFNLQYNLNSKILENTWIQ